LRRYFWAVASGALAICARLILDRVLGYHHPYAVIYVAVLLSAWYGGLGPGLLTTGLGGLGALLLGVPPGFEFYLIVCLTGVILLDAQGRAERRSALNAETARRRLEELRQETRQRKEAEETARQFEEELHLTFEHAPVGICQFSLDGSLTEVNPRFCEITGYAQDQLLHYDFFRLMLAAGTAAARTRYAALRRGTSPVWKEEKRFTRTDGSVIWVDLAISLVRSSTGEPQYGVAVVEDVTSRKRSQDQLREAQKLESVGLLAGGIAHDFNNLLTGVLGNACLAIDALPAESAARHMLEGVVSAAERAAELTAQLLAYAGKGEFVTGDVDLSTVVREVVFIVSLSLPPNAEIRLQVRDGLPTIRADRSQIQQLLSNLVINAAEAIGNRLAGRITVATDLARFDGRQPPLAPRVGQVREGYYVGLRVEDTGEGMEEATIQRIFDPFFSTRFTGRGLGLAAVSGIVRARDGAVMVSSSPERGSTFSVWFPLVESGLRILGSCADESAAAA
jgi:PAS domain S-box-containing protein